MKKLFALTALALCFIHCSAFAAQSLDEKIAKVEHRYEQRIERIDNMKRGTEERKDMLKKHAREDADLKIQQLKDLDTLKPAKKSPKKS